MRKLRTALLLACLGWAPAACGTGFLQGNPDNSVVEDTDYQESAKPIVGASLDAIWEKAREVLSMEGVDLDSGRTRFADRLMVTHWDTLLAPSRYEGRRTRLWVRFREQKPGEWIVGVAAQRQVNGDIDAPSEPTKAKWEDRPAVEGRSRTVLYKIELAFRSDDPETTGAK